MGSIRIPAELDVDDNGHIYIALAGSDLETDWDSDSHRDITIAGTACDILVGRDGQAVGLRLSAPSGSDYTDTPFGPIWERPPP